MVFFCMRGEGRGGCIIFGEIERKRKRGRGRGVGDLDDSKGYSICI